MPFSLSILTAFSSGPVFEILKDPNEYYKKWGIVRIPPIDIWLRYYNREDIELEWFFDWLEEELKDPYFFNLIITHLKFVKRRVKSLIKNAGQFRPFFTIQQVINFAKWLEGIDLDYLEKDLNLESKTKCKNKHNDSPIMVFLIRVWLPCYYYFGDLPQNLFKGAKNGDFKALCDLLSIDKAILGDSTILEIFNTISLDTDSEQFKTLSRAINSPIKIKSKKKLKEITASIMSASSEVDGKKLTTPQIQSLFDHVAKIKNKDALIDTDIESIEALAKHIQRKAPAYKKLFEA